MLVHFNTMVKDEEDLLQVVLPFWVKYPVDKFVFFNDSSSDSTVDVIKKHIPVDRLHIIDSDRNTFSESHNRSAMLEYSRKVGADYVLTIDCDELLSANFEGMFQDILQNYETTNFLLYWYNVVEGSVNKLRQDPSYASNYRSFILPMKHTGHFDLTQWKYHTPRTPQIHLPAAVTHDIGVIHLQAINTEFYALKQLWYKHYEFINYNHSVEFINDRYDPVVNSLQFNTVATPEDIVAGIEIDPSIFNTILEKKGYRQYILDNYNEQLVTFGKEYL